MSTDYRPRSYAQGRALAAVTTRICQSPEVASCQQRKCWQHDSSPSRAALAATGDAQAAFGREMPDEISGTRIHAALQPCQPTAMRLEPNAAASGSRSQLPTAEMLQRKHTALHPKCSSSSRSDHQHRATARAVCLKSKSAFKKRWARVRPRAIRCTAQIWGAVPARFFASRLHVRRQMLTVHAPRADTCPSVHAVAQLHCSTTRLRENLKCAPRKR